MRNLPKVEELDGPPVQQPETYDGAAVTCPHCGKHVPGARLTWRTIAVQEAHALARALNIPTTDILNNSRRATAWARHQLWERLRTKHGWSNSRIARACGGVDVTTVLYALRSVERRKAAAHAA